MLIVGSLQIISAVPEKLFPSSKRISSLFKEENELGIVPVNSLRFSINEFILVKRPNSCGLMIH